MTPLPPGEELIERVAIAIRDLSQGEGFDYMDFCRDAARVALTAIEPELIRLRGEVDRKDEALRKIEKADTCTKSAYVLNHKEDREYRYERKVLGESAKIAHEALKGREAK